ncbi:MAG TPA: hypothetical protein H9852_03945 [Candidatus Mediterraneibacter colneyensis]|nr:hypothetical protein [Candidatus Mediterraneibacter colneyensis]
MWIADKYIDHVKEQTAAHPGESWDQMLLGFKLNKLRTLEVSLDELGAIALNSGEKIEITSMCSVFAESEVISLIANNKEKADIADGVCHAIANKASGLLRRVGMEPEFMMTGGVAKNPGVVRAVEEKIGSKLYICEEPEIVGAAGAALYAFEKMED